MHHPIICFHTIISNLTFSTLGITPHPHTTTPSHSYTLPDSLVGTLIDTADFPALSDAVDNKHNMSNGRQLAIICSFLLVPTDQLSRTIARTFAQFGTWREMAQHYIQTQLNTGDYVT